MLEACDHLEIYCPHLGMITGFAYCRRAQSSLPCRNMVGCWEKRVLIENFLTEHFTLKELEAAFGGLPKTRLERIFDQLERTKKAGGL
jgi:hypothetical protein